MEPATIPHNMLVQLVHLPQTIHEYVMDHLLGIVHEQDDDLLNLVVNQILIVQSMVLVTILHNMLAQEVCLVL